MTQIPSGESRTHTAKRTHEEKTTWTKSSSTTSTEGEKTTTLIYIYIIYIYVIYIYIYRMTGFPNTCTNLLQLNAPSSFLTRRTSTRVLSASDWCALREALYKLIDRIEYNTRLCIFALDFTRYQSLYNVHIHNNNTG